MTTASARRIEAVVRAASVKALIEEAAPGLKPDVFGSGFGFRGPVRVEVDAAVLLVILSMLPGASDAVS